MRVKDYELIRCNDGGEVRVWYDGQIDILKESHMTVGFREAKRRQTTPPEARQIELKVLKEVSDDLSLHGHGLAAARVERKIHLLSAESPLAALTDLERCSHGVWKADYCWECNPPQPQ